MMNFRSAAGGSGGGPVLKWSGGSSSSNSNNPCLEQHSINIAATTTTTPTTITTTTAQGFMQITNNMYEGLIDQDSFISSPSLASTAAACINSGYCSTRASTGSDILYYLSVLKEKVQQLQALVATAISNHTHHHHQNHEKEHPAAAATSAASLIHEIIFAASSMAYAFQQLSPVSPPGHLQCKSSELIDHHQQNHYKKQAAPSYAINHDHHDASQLATTDNNTCIHQHQLSTFSSEAAAAAAGGGQYYNIFAAAAGTTVNETQCQYNTINTTDVEIAKKISDATRTSSGAMGAMELVGNINDTDHKEADDHAIIELEAADLLAKYTHFCQVCGKGFRRDANLRMHMRAHGDEYKTNEALTNPMKRQMLMMKNNKSSTSTSTNDELMLEEDPHEEEFAAASTAAAGLVVGPQNRNQKYSCPHEGCRWNKKHAKFQPLKSMVCVKNHYKRSHCPKMYVCNRCNRKQFSVLSDLRTHEKHCGDNLRWRCSCGTTFSRKDKLMGHVALFVGHAPAIAPHHNNTRSISAPLPTD